MEIHGYEQRSEEETKALLLERDQQLQRATLELEGYYREREYSS
jgi:hypothetical protein